MDYRLYFLDQDNRINGVVELDCASDDLAVEAAQRHREGKDLELWQGARVVAKIPKHDQDQSTFS